MRPICTHVNTRLFLLLGLLGTGVPVVARGAEGAADYDAKVRPLLNEFCGKCHGAEKAKAEVNLAKFGDVASIHRDPKLWRNVLTQLNERTMPPENKPQPSDAQRAMLIQWIQHTLNNPDPAAFAKDPGRVTLRRLNRFEYNNTVRDLFDVGARPAEKFPADGAGGAGFDNNADTLFIPPILLEQYLAAATEVLKDTKTDNLLIAKPSDELPKRDAAKKILEHWTYRAFRRPVTDSEIDRYLKLF